MWCVVRTSNRHGPTTRYGQLSAARPATQRWHADYHAKRGFSLSICRVGYQMQGQGDAATRFMLARRPVQTPSQHSNLLTPLRRSKVQSRKKTTPSNLANKSKSVEDALISSLVACRSTQFVPAECRHFQYLRQVVLHMSDPITTLILPYSP